MFLLRNLEGSRSFAGRLTLLGGEKLRWLEREGELQLLEVSFPANTNVLDRSSRFNRWQVRKSREELEAVINQHYPIGSLIDIAVRKRGPSHRVLELLMTGTERQTVARGLRIRTALGLRDILFEVDREYDAEGRVTHFVFSGRGWGHGVGLVSGRGLRHGPSRSEIPGHPEKVLSRRPHRQDLLIPGPKLLT